MVGQGYAGPSMHEITTCSLENRSISSLEYNRRPTLIRDVLSFLFSPFFFLLPPLRSFIVWKFGIISWSNLKSLLFHSSSTKFLYREFSEKH